MSDTNDPALILQNITSALLNHQTDNAKNILNNEYPFAGVQAKKRKYSESMKLRIFLRDGFIDRYTGKKLVFSGMLRLISLLMPEEFPYHPNWKMDQCHIAYWQLSPTLDHIFPVARGGLDDESNWVTTSMISNAQKDQWTLEELGWELLPAGDLAEWDGLINAFIQLVEIDKTLIEYAVVKKNYDLAKKALK